MSRRAGCQFTQSDHNDHCFAPRLASAQWSVPLANAVAHTAFRWSGTGSHNLSGSGLLDTSLSRRIEQYTRGTAGHGPITRLMGRWFLGVATSQGPDALLARDSSLADQVQVPGYLAPA